MPKVVAWRRDIHEHPELGNRETRTAGLVAAHLRSLGLEVRTGLARTGVVAVLKGGKPGPVVALRADMDALPVTEETGLPFPSTVRTTYNGKEVGVMHACGHDTHTAMLLGAARGAGRDEGEPPGHGGLSLPAGRGRRPGGRRGRGEPAHRRRGPRQSQSRSGLRPACLSQRMGLAQGPAGRDHGRKPDLPHHRPGAADACRPALVRDRSDRRLGPDHPRPPDDRQPPVRIDQGARRRLRRA